LLLRGKPGDSITEGFSLKEIDPATVDHFIHLAVEKNRLTDVSLNETPQVILEKLELMADGKLKNGAVLLFDGNSYCSKFSTGGTRMERVMIFVDGSNFYYGLKGNRCSTRVDSLKLSHLLTGAKRKLIRTYYYNAAYNQDDDPEKYAEQLKFFTMLKRTPYKFISLDSNVMKSCLLDK